MAGTIPTSHKMPQLQLHDLLEFHPWCSEYYPKQWDRKLSNALYTFRHSHLVTAPPTEETHFLRNDFALLEKGISQALDVNVDMFPQHAPQKINSNEFYHFFYIDTASEVRQCRKDLQKLVTMEIAQQYQQRRFSARMDSVIVSTRGPGTGP